MSESRLPDCIIQAGIVVIASFYFSWWLLIQFMLGATVHGVLKLPMLNLFNI
jgi:hypothetical protein